MSEIVLYHCLIQLVLLSRLKRSDPPRRLLFIPAWFYLSDRLSVTGGGTQEYLLHDASLLTSFNGWPINQPRRSLG